MMPARISVVTVGMACWLACGVARAQWAPAGEQERLFQKAILDVGTVSLQSFGEKDTPWDPLQGQEPIQSAVEWVRFQGYATYCLPKADLPVGPQPMSALILMDPDRKAYVALFLPSMEGVEVRVSRAYLMQCP